MNETIQALLAKKWKDADLDLPVGETSIFQEFVVRISGTVEKSEDSWVTPTVSIPLISTLGFDLPKMRRSGRIDTKTLTVSVEALDATLAAA